MTEDKKDDVLDNKYFIQNWKTDRFDELNYLTSAYRYSIIEKILMKSIFQPGGKGTDYTLIPFLKSFNNDKDRNKFLETLIQNYDAKNPLYFFNNIAKELKILKKENDLSKLQIKDYIKKIEFFLAWHFENNFYPKTDILDKLSSLHDNLYLSNGIANFLYSVESINTIEHFMKVFEKQTLCTKIEGDINLIENCFCSEKAYYFYCHKIGKGKESCGNLIKSLLESLDHKIEKVKSINNKINPIDLENYIMMNLYLIDKIIQNYPFYLHKNPEIAEIFEALEKYKGWPCPISNYCNRIMDNIINENSFQGISLLNKLRQAYFLDLIDQDITVMDTEIFRYTIIFYSKEMEYRNENDKSFDLIKFIKYLHKKPENKHNRKLIIKEILIKLLITIIYNSDQNYNDDTFRKIYNLYMPNYKKIYENDSIVQNDKVKASLDKLFQIIDFGFDKPIVDFITEINKCAFKIVSELNNKEIQCNSNSKEDNIYKNNFYLPIDSMRNYLKPNYSTFACVKGDNQFNIFDYYINNVLEIVGKYFQYFLNNPSDPIASKNLNMIRRNFLKNFYINVLLFEKENTLNDLIEDFQNKIFNELRTKISEQDFDSFWIYFVDKKTDIIPKFILYVVPCYDRKSSNPFQLYTEMNTLKNSINYLSEFIASHDFIYKNMIFMPFSSTCDNELNKNVSQSPEKSNDPMQNPDINIFYSPLRKTLDYYLGDSQGIFYLDLYQVTIKDNSNNETLKSKVIYKNIEILDTQEIKTNKKTSLTIKYVDSLGIEFKDQKTIELVDNFDIKLYNLFYKNNVPFCYNMKSNNGWLEMFLDEHFTVETNEKFCNFRNFFDENQKTKFYEEVNIPQTDIESRFKNYKVKSVNIITDSPSILIRCDDYMDLPIPKKNESIGEQTDTNRKKTEVNPKKNEQIPEEGNGLYKITIEPFLVNGKKYSLPIATFTTI